MTSRSVAREFFRKDLPLSLAATIMIGLFGHFNAPDKTIDSSQWNWVVVPLSNFYHWASTQVGGEMVLLVIVFAADLSLSLGIRGLVRVYQRVKVASEEDKIRWLSGRWLVLNSFALNAAIFGLSSLLELLSGMSDEKRARLFGQPLMDWKHDHRFLWVAVPFVIFWLAFALLGHQIRVRTWPETKSPYKKAGVEEAVEEVDYL